MPMCWRFAGIRAASGEWMTRLSEGISPEELEIFHKVLERMQETARKITEQEEGCK